MNGPSVRDAVFVHERHFRRSTTRRTAAASVQGPGSLVVERPAEPGLSELVATEALVCHAVKVVWV
jgi:hypothetical protein